MAGNLVKRVMLKIVADDLDAEAKLDLISKKADELGEKHPELKVRIDTAAASAKLAVLRHELKNAGDQSGETGGIFSKLSGLISGSSGTGGLVGALTSATPIFGLSSVSLGVIGVAAFAAAAALTPLIASLGLVGVGIGGFAVLAKGEVSKVFTALSEHGKQLTATLKQMSPAERDLVKSAQPLKAEFHKLQQAIQPYVVKAFGDGIKILKELFPALKPLVEAAGKALDHFLKSIANWLNGPSGKKFLHWMETEGPHAIKEFGHALEVGLKAVGRFADFLFNTGETMRRNWFRYMHDISNALDVLRESWIRVGHDIESAWDHTVSFVTTTGGKILNWFQALPGRIMGFLSSLPSMLFNAGKNIISHLISGIESMLGPVGSAIGSIVSKITSFLPFSPAKEGPLSGSGSPDVSGRKIALMLAQGMDSGHGHVAAAAQRMAAATAAGASGARTHGHGGPGAAGQPVVVQLVLNGSDTSIMTALAKAIRAQGGDPRVLFQKVSALV